MLPHFDSSGVVYDTPTETNKANRQFLPTRYTKIITCSGPWTNCNSMFGQFGWLSLF